MLPLVVEKEILDIRYKLSDSAILYFVDELEQLGFVISNTVNNDITVSILFINHLVSGRLRIDRQNRLLEIRNDNEINSFSIDKWDEATQYLMGIK